MMMMMMMMKSRFDLSFIRVFVSIAGRASEGCLCVRVLLLSGLGRTRVRVIFRQTVHLSCVSVFSFHYESLSFLSVCVSLLMLERECEDIDFFEVFFGVTPAGRWAKKKRKEKYGGGQQHRMR